MPVIVAGRADYLKNQHRTALAEAYAGAVMRRAKDPHKVFKRLIKAAEGAAKPLTDADRRLRLIASMRGLMARGKGKS